MWDKCGITLWVGIRQCDQLAFGHGNIDASSGDGSTHRRLFFAQRHLPDRGSTARGITPALPHLFAISGTIDATAIKLSQLESA